MHRHDARLTVTGRAEPLGPTGERLAVAHLVGDDGLEVVCANWRRRRGDVRGELDVVALDRTTGTVVIVEVKTRRSGRHGGPLVAVTAAKQGRIRALTAALLRDHVLPYRRVRFDVIGILLPWHGDGHLDHVPGAF